MTQRYNRFAGLAWALLIAGALVAPGPAQAKGKKSRGKKATASKKAGKQAGPAATPTGFRAQLKAAHELPDVAMLAPYLWSYLSTCDKIESDFEKRQCRGLRAARQVQVATKTFAIAGQAPSVEVGEFNKRKRSIELRVRSCLSCTQPVDVQGRALYIVGEGKPEVSGGAVRAPVVHATARVFKTEKQAQTWNADVVPRLRTRFLVRIPGNTAVWTEGDARGVGLDIVGYRVHDPCTGEVIASRPKAEALPADPKTCTGEDLAAIKRAEEARKPKVVKPTGPVLPERLTPDEIKNALDPAQAKAQECYAIYGVSGGARFRLTFSGDGTITKLQQEGDFIGTPTGKCIEKAVRATVFPKSQKAATRVNYPIVLR